MLEAAFVCLAMAVYHEARGEPLAGQLAVAAVVLNRVDDDRHPNTICDVVKEGPTHANGHPRRHLCQFSFWCDGRPERTDDAEAWETAKIIATFAIDQPLDLSEGATYYHASTVSPQWRHAMDVTVRIGGHIFYRH